MGSICGHSQSGSTKNTSSGDRAPSVARLEQSSHTCSLRPINVLFEKTCTNMFYSSVVFLTWTSAFFRRLWSILFAYVALNSYFSHYIILHVEFGLMEKMVNVAQPQSANLTTNQNKLCSGHHCTMCQHINWTVNNSSVTVGDSRLDTDINHNICSITLKWDGKKN